MDGTFSSGNIKPGSFVNILHQIIQKLNKLKTDQDDQFLHLKFGIENIQQRLCDLQKQRYERSSDKEKKKLNELDKSSIHKEVLQENLDLLMKDIDLEHADLIDDLQTGECLTSDEALEIRQKPTRRDQVRKLIVQLGRKSEMRFNVFLENMQKKSNYPHIAESLISSYNKRKEIMESGGMKRCLTCVLKRDVQIKDVIDKLYSNRLVPIEIFEEVAEKQHLDNKLSWDIILTQLKRSREPRKTRQVLQEALARKYEHVAARINKTQFPEVLCRCNDTMSLYVPGSLRSDTTGSIGEASTTSEFYQTRIHQTDGLRSESVSSTKSESSMQIDYENIPSTVAWLESIPFDNEFAPHENIDATGGGVAVTEKCITNPSDGVINMLINESRSTLVDHQSFLKDKHPSNLLDSNSINSFDLDSVSTYGAQRMDLAESDASVISNNMSYASVVSSKSHHQQHAIKDKCAHNPSYKGEKHVTSDKYPPTTKMKNSKRSFKADRTRSQTGLGTDVIHTTRSVESLSEIGTIFMSQVDNEKINNSSNNISKTFGRRSKPTTGVNTLSGQNNFNTSTPVTTETSNRSIDQHCMILEQVFFAEQEKIHKTASTNSKTKSEKVATNHLEKEKKVDDSLKKRISRRKKKNMKKKAF